MQMQWDNPCAFQPDIIVAADILYDPGEPLQQLGPALLSSLSMALTVLLQLPWTLARLYTVFAVEPALQ